MTKNGSVLKKLASSTFIINAINYREARMNHL